MRHNLELFETFVMRAPVYPISDFLKIFENSKVDVEKLISICAKKEFLEAIYLSSPTLYQEFKKLISNKIETEKEKEKLYITIFKYFSRMSCRCTPFGVFATVDTGKFAERDNLTVSSYKEVSKVTRLDMDCIGDLSYSLSSKPEIKNKLIFRANDSIYYVGDKLRCVEYKYVNGSRSHHIFESQKTDIIQNVLGAVNGGKTLSQLKDHLLVTEDVDEEYEDVIYNFLNELVDSQLLISELSPTTIGEGALTRLIRKMSLRVPESKELKILQNIRNGLGSINDTIVENGTSQYDHVIEEIGKININGNHKNSRKGSPKYVFQTDARRDVHNLTLDRQIKDDIVTTLLFLNKFSLPNKNGNLESFKSEYARRYDSDIIPLTVALDNEIGIPYGRDAESSNVSPLVDDLRLPSSPEGSNSSDIVWTSINSLLLEKYIHAIKNDLSKVEITDDDISGVKQALNGQDFPATFSALIQVFEEEGNKKISLRHAGGSSAINLIARFCHVDKDIQNHAKKIADYEDDFYKDQIVAEINHLPESRIGNVLYRPRLRTHQIGYLDHNSNEESKNIDVSDIFVTIKQNRIVLLSKKYNKEVIPRMSTAHNYTNNSLPIYRFLCDLQTQNLVQGVKFNWGPLVKLYPFRPRVVYKNIIVSLASWVVKVKEFLNEISQSDDDDLLDSVNVWRMNRKMPQWVSIKYGDNELVINLTNLLSIKTLLSMIKNRVSVELYEVPMTNSLTKGIEGKLYSNEIIVAFKNINQ